MRVRRWLVCILALIGFVYSSLVIAGDLVRFLSPRANDFVFGPTKIQLAVEEGAPILERVDLYVRGKLIGTARPPEWSCTYEAESADSGAGIIAVVYADGEMVGQVRLRTKDFYFGESLDVAVVQLYPVVVDLRGRYVKGLAKEDFLVFDQGSPMDIEYFSTEATSLSIAIVLDVSDSMFDKLSVVKDASCGFVDKLSSEDDVSVYAFNHGLDQVLPLTRDHRRVAESIRSLQSGGGTALYDALVRVLDDMSGVTGRRAVFLFSDGLDELSNTSLENVVIAARNSEAIVYAVGAGSDRRSREARKDLRVLAEETGGNVYSIENIRELPQVFDSVLTHLRSQYVLSYPAPKGPPGLRSLEVRCKKIGLRVRCRKSYNHGGA